MSYARPAYDAAYATFSGLDAYTRPDYDNAWASFQAPAEDVVAYLAVASPLASPAVLASVAAAGTLAVPSVLQSPALLGQQPPFGWVSVAGPLDGAVELLGLHDFTAGATDLSPPRFVVYLDTPAGEVMVPASSCQGTLQIGESGYLQVVIPNAGAYVSAIEEATSIRVARRGSFGGVEVETPIASSAVSNVSIAQGAYNHSATLSGTTPPSPSPPDPLPSPYVRAVDNVRVMFTSYGARRLRCDIDWLMRPGFRAAWASTTIDVDFINFYLTRAGDSFMDVGERA